MLQRQLSYTIKTQLKPDTIVTVCLYGLRVAYMQGEDLLQQYDDPTHHRFSLCMLGPRELHSAEGAPAGLAGPGLGETGGVRPVQVQADWPALLCPLLSDSGGTVEHSHWSRSIETLCSDWLRS